MKIEHDTLKEPNYIYVSFYKYLDSISFQGFKTNYHVFYKTGMSTIGVWNVKYKNDLK